MHTHKKHMKHTCIFALSFALRTSSQSVGHLMRKAVPICIWFEVKLLVCKNDEKITHHIAFSYI